MDLGLVIDASQEAEWMLLEVDTIRIFLHHRDPLGLPAISAS